MAAVGDLSPCCDRGLSSVTKEAPCRGGTAPCSPEHSFPGGQHWLSHPGWAIPASLFQPQPAFPVFKVPGGVREEHTWLNTGCNLGALQAGNSEAACSNRHWELDVLTQDPNDATAGLQQHLYSALTIIQAMSSQPKRSAFTNPCLLTSPCWKAAISTSLHVGTTINAQRALPTPAATPAPDATAAAGSKLLQALLAELPDPSS